MKVVPLADQSGHIPLRTSKNPVLGVFRHHCGAIATVHQPKGRKANLRYLLCDTCGCDQCSGEEYQARIREQMQPSIEALEQIEPLGSEVTEKPTAIEPTQTNENAVHTVVEPVEKNEPILTEPEPIETVKPIENTDDNKSFRVAVSAVFGGIFGGILALVL